MSATAQHGGPFSGLLRVTFRLDTQAKTSPPQGIGIAVRRVLSLALVAGYIDALGFFDLNGIYTAAMTGNTVQLGIDFVREQ